MKNNYYFPHVATFFFLLTVIVALVSWIGSIYGLGTVQSLLSPKVSAGSLDILQVIMLRLRFGNYNDFTLWSWNSFL